MVKPHMYITFHAGLFRTALKGADNCCAPQLLPNRLQFGGCPRIFSPEPLNPHMMHPSAAIGWRPAHKAKALVPAHLCSCNGMGRFLVLPYQPGGTGAIRV